MLKRLLLLIAICLAAANPVKDATRQDVKETLVKDDNVKRGAVTSSRYKWPITTFDGKNTVIIPFVTDSGLNSKAKSELARAIQELHAVTCVRFLPWSGQSDYVSFEGGSICQSQIGKREGKEIIYLGTGCEIKGIILHELIHLLGFYHEHSRPDRDSYIRIFEDNIMDGAKQEIMKKYQPGEMDNLGFSYDLHSIMQYEKTTFAKQEGLVTMEAISDPNMELGNQNAMSAADIMKINKLYHCPGSNDQYKNMEVTVTTASGGWFSSPGTDSFLYLELIGQGGKRSGESSVAKGGHYDDFESGQTDSYLVAFKDVGSIRQLKVRLQENPEGGYFDGWTFDRIVIKDGNQVYTFCGEDLDAGDSVTVDASQSCP